MVPSLWALDPLLVEEGNILHLRAVVWLVTGSDAALVLQKWEFELAGEEAGNGSVLQRGN